MDTESTHAPSRNVHRSDWPRRQLRRRFPTLLPQFLREALTTCLAHRNLCGAFSTIDCGGTDAVPRRARNARIFLPPRNSAMKRTRFRATVKNLRNPQSINASPDTRLDTSESIRKDKTTFVLSFIVVYATNDAYTVSYTHLRAHETRHDLVC